MKRFFENLKLSRKLLIAPLIGIAFLSVFGIVGYKALSTQKLAIEELFQSRFKSYQASAGLIKDVTSAHANLYKIISWANANYEAKKIDDLGKEQMAVLERAGAVIGTVLKGTGLSPEEKRLCQEIANQLAEYNKAAFAAMDLASSDLNFATTYMGTADAKFQGLYKDLRALVALEEKLGQVKYDSSLQSYNAALRLFIIIFAIAIGGTLLTSVLIARLISSPVRETTNVVQRIAAGDLTEELHISAHDEIGDLARAVDSMRLNMGRAVGQSVETSQLLSAAASEQASSIEETSASLEELASMTKMNTENTNQANSLMTTTKGVIQQANHSMNDLTKSISEITQAGEQTQKIVKTIDEIAFQTNLLALNAAVEAARAGEVGAGFAVVADEVRNLAKRAAEAAKNTSNLMADIVKKIRAGGDLVTATNTAFQQVSSGSDKVVNLIGEIVTASREQSEGIDQINQAIAQMNGVTQQNAASAEELAASMAMFKTNRHDAERRNEVIVA
ncbi:MAG: HAMP domain-containing methyl-accepting chemotaxis protein [Syntrophales bacterium]